ncbi:MAG: hypothetical protein KKE65_05375 [Actinobacteria bacterium]|nr:hypothetical protein [Actinomycetota bacterium]MBU2111070.1 hypothetical protein [Actinomycetota bacterium]
MTLVVRLVAAVFAALLSVPSASAISLATPVAVSHEYASHYDSAALNYTTPERGPPKTYNGRTNDDAVDRWSRGTSARSNGPAPTPLYAYDHPALLVPAASVATTRGGDVVRHDGVLSSPDRSKVAANAGRRAFDIHPRVSGQLNDPRLGALRGKLTSDDLQDLAHNPNANYLLDSATGNINVIQEVDGVILRITTPRDAFKIISVGRMRPSQVPNGLESGRFVPIGPGG